MNDGLIFRMKLQDTENLQNVEHLFGREIGAMDGTIGSVDDFLFDDQTWEVRYVVANTGGWLSGKQVLLSPYAFIRREFGAVDSESGVLHVNLTRKQVEESPSIDEHQPVSRQYEEEYHQYYGWPTYWGGGGVGGLGAFPVIVPPPSAEVTDLEEADTHLRSMKEVIGYHVQATDEEVGSVTGLMVGIDEWKIRYIQVECGHWYARKMIFILPENIIEISYVDSTILLNLSQDDIKQTDDFDVARP
jgi:hypothetical protein